MKLKIAFLTSRVGRRIFFLFVSCALLPLITLGVMSFVKVRAQLDAQSQERLRHGSKDTAMGVVGRLTLLVTEMEMVASHIKTDSWDRGAGLHKELNRNLLLQFKSLVFGSETVGFVALVGQLQDLPTLEPKEQQHLSSGKPLLLSRGGDGLFSRVFVAIELNPANPAKRVLLGEISPKFLFGTSEGYKFSPTAELCVLDSSNDLLFSTLPQPESTSLLSKLGDSNSSSLEWEHGGHKYQSSSWSLPLGFRWLTPHWTVVVSESRTAVFAPIANFQATFPLILLATLLFVALLTVVQIRKNLIPLEKLKEGTARISEKDFGLRVTVQSGDEFEELAESFNNMVKLLGRQFSILETAGEIDRAILSALHTDQIITTALKRIPDLFDLQALGLVIIDSKAASKGRIYITNRARAEKVVKTIRLTPENMEQISTRPRGLPLEFNGNVPSYLTPMREQGVERLFILPISTKERLLGMIVLGYAQSRHLSTEDQTQARQLANQVAVALSNAHLIEELHDLHWGTLTALARAVDAKSPWTAGHSERVAELSLRIGQVLQLSSNEMEIIHRGSLLHDIGKIGVPAKILDKAGRLTDEEYSAVKKHALLGARILEPISAYSEVIPIVLHHHERLDGKGYPDGLIGDAIRFDVRIVTVADAFDAITSDRPYRLGMLHNRAVKLLKRETGTHFDPDVVGAFLEVMPHDSGSILGSRLRYDLKEQSSSWRTNWEGMPRVPEENRLENLD